VTAFVMDLVITALYLVGAYLCFRAGGRPGEEGDLGASRRVRIFWYAAAAMLLALGINKPLDLHVLITRIGRDVSREGGWYGARRQVQAVFFTGVLCLAVGAVI